MACSIYFIKPHMNYMKQPAEKKTPDRRLYMKRTRILPYILAIQYSYLLGDLKGGTYGLLAQKVKKTSLMACSIYLTLSKNGM